MRPLLSILFLALSSVCFAQSKDSTVARTLQIKKLTKVDSTIRANQKQFTEMLELIFGVPIEQVESWSLDNGYFKWKFKPKKK